MEAAISVTVKVYSVASQFAGTMIVRTASVVSSGYRDVQVALPLPSVSCAVDLKVYVDGSYNADYSAGLQGLLPSDLGVKTLTFTEVRGTKYSVAVQIAVAGSSEYAPYYKYTVDPVAGKANVTEKHSFKEPVKTTEAPKTTEPVKTTETPKTTEPAENSAADVSDAAHGEE